jgi:hypothetical protein
MFLPYQNHHSENSERVQYDTTWDGEVLVQCMIVNVQTEVV